MHHLPLPGRRIGLAYEGIREGGFSADKTPPDAVPVDRDLHAHEVGYYFTDEDATNRYDETPPDLHAQAGMSCADCHVGPDVHGDGNLYTSERYQVGIRCEDCHGTPRERASPNPDTGSFENSRGAALVRLQRTDQDRLVLTRLMDQGELDVPEVTTALAARYNLAMTQAMGVDKRGFSHTDKMECYVCHTSWRQTCFGCHTTVDDRAFARNATTGQMMRGAASVTRDDYSTEFYALGVNARGNITTLGSSMSMFWTYIDEDGEVVYKDRVRTSGDGLPGFGWNPFFHHTTSRVPVNCDRCHSAGGENAATLAETYGYGTGEFVVADGQGVPHDLSAFLGPDGELLGDFPHPNTGPVPSGVRERAIAVEVIPHPRQSQQ